jgi:hypothetical protein
MTLVGHQASSRVKDQATEAAGQKKTDRYVNTDLEQQELALS